MIWLLIALMTGAAVLAVLWPLSRRARDLRQASDVAVYKDQLEEIERDQSFGLIAPAEADAARVEVSRRLLAADSAMRGRKAATDSPPARRRAVAAGALVLVPASAVAIYLALGSPDLPGAPLSSRVAQAHGGDRSIEEMFARVEQHLAEHPEDGKGWEVVAPIYMRLGRYDDAVRARQNAVRLLGPTAERWSDLGEALIAMENGVVTDNAKQAFENALKIDAKDISARFYLGLAAEQDGRKDEAARIWKALAADAPPGAEWLASVQRALARVDSAAAGAVASAAQSAPPGSDSARGMVERLAARLKQDGSDVDGWLQLLRSYRVLNDPDKARAAEADARRALADDKDKLARLEAGLKELTATAEGAPLPPPQDLSIDQMVARLAARLARDGGNVEGWIQLVRSYRVLEQPDKASAAEADARRALAGDPSKLANFEAGIKQVAAAPPASEQAATDRRATESPAAGAAPAAPPAGQHEIRGMVDRLAARLKQDGSDVDGWIQLVRSYTVLDDADKARAAESDARRALADDPAKLARLDAGLKEIAASSAAGAPPPATSSAAQAGPAGPTPPQDQTVLGMVDRLAARLKQDGSDVDGWIRLVRSYTVLNDADKARAAESDARRALANDPAKLAQLDAGLKEIAASSAAGAPPPPMSSAAPAAPAGPTPPQDQMIRGMVDRLAARLQQDGSDVDGWLRLLRSYVVLGEPDKARAAAADARNALKGDADKLRRLDEGAQSLGVGG
jgi:cytochrome c-type biogenesis protein CcmH